MRFVVIRHGQSTNNLLWEETGDSAGRHHDSPLTELGQLQADRLATTVTEGALPWTITHIYASLMTRAVQTAAPLAKALDLPVRGHDELHELGGIFLEDSGGARTIHPGAPAADLLAITDNLVLPPSATEDGWFNGSIEDDRQLTTERAQRVIAGLREQHEDSDVVALVTHGAFCQYLFRTLLGIEQMTGWLRKNNTAISLFSDYPEPGGNVTAYAINWMPHLAPEQVSY